MLPQKKIILDKIFKKGFLSFLLAVAISCLLLSLTQQEEKLQNTQLKILSAVSLKSILALILSFLNYPSQQFIRIYNCSTKFQAKALRLSVMHASTIPSTFPFILHAVEPLLVEHMPQLILPPLLLSTALTKQMINATAQPSSLIKSNLLTVKDISMSAQSKRRHASSDQWAAKRATTISSVMTTLIHSITQIQMPKQAKDILH